MMFYSVPGMAQDSPRIFHFAKVQYTIPASWESDPFGSYRPDDWYDSGSAVCECTGIIHLDSIGDLKMVFYPSLPQYVDSLKHQYIRDYRYQPAKMAESIKVGRVRMERQVSRFTNSDEYEVWRYKTYVGKYGYLIYFFGTPEIMQANSKTIEDIMASFKKSRHLKFKLK